MNPIYRVTPNDSEYIIFECSSRKEAEDFALKYDGGFKVIIVKQYFLRDATKEELNDL